MDRRPPSFPEEDGETGREFYVGGRGRSKPPGTGRDHAGAPRPMAGPQTG